MKRRILKSLATAVLLAGVLPACGSGGEEGAGEPPAPVPDPPMAEPDPVDPGRAPGPGPYAPGVDVLDYRVEMDLWEDTDEIRAVARIRIHRTDAAADRVVFDLTGLAVDSVLIGPEAYRRLERVPSDTYRDSLSRGRLPVSLLGDSAAGDTLSIVVHYRGTPDDGLILGNTPHGHRSAFADNWPDRARFWFPSVDHPSDKATVTFVVRAPAEWQVVANGAPLSPPTPVPDAAPRERGAVREASRRTWRWETRAPIPTYTMVVGGTPFAVRQLGLAACGRAPLSPRRDGCVEVSAWLFPPDTARAAPSFERAARMVDFFTGLVGPFPYEKLAHVEAATRFGGMENASAIFYPGEVLAAGRDLEETVAHETAHQWFGDSVTESDWHHLWLSEGFAEYFEALFFEEADGTAAFRERMARKRATYLASGVADRPVIDEEQDDLFALLTPNNYEKGAWVLHMLRGLLGDEAFFRGIRRYYAAHTHGTALTEDFRAAMEEAGGGSLGWFFDQWLRRPGYPVVTAEASWDPDEERAHVVLRQLQPDRWPTFRLPATVEVEVEGGETVRQEIELTERVEEVYVALPAPPTGVRFDPDGWVLTGEPDGIR